LYAGAAPGGDLGAEIDGFVRATCTTAVTVDIRFWLTADRSTAVHTTFAEFGRCNSAAPCSLTRRGPAPERGGDHARRRPLFRLETAQRLSPRRRACVRDQSYDDGSWP